MRLEVVPKNVDEYIANFSEPIQIRLAQIRTIILENIPDAEEGISHQMPAYKYLGSLAYFGAHKEYIGFYPLPSAVKAFKEELSPYYTSRGAIQFPNDQPIPTDLISAIIAFRITENEERKNKRRSDLI